MVKPVAFVTGASSGIGLELSRLLAAAGHDLVLVGRSAERLDQTVRELHDRYGVQVESRRRDLSEPGAAETLWRELMAGGVAVDILVNNAGVGLHGAFGQQDPEAISRLVTLNVTALTTLTWLALPEMLARRSGRILNVASLVAFQPGAQPSGVGRLSTGSPSKHRKNTARYRECASFTAGSRRGVPSQRGFHSIFRRPTRLRGIRRARRRRHRQYG
jgi:short-subunit dehydrogenase